MVVVSNCRFYFIHITLAYYDRYLLYLFLTFPIPIIIHIPQLSLHREPLEGTFKFKKFLRACVVPVAQEFARSMAQVRTKLFPLPSSGSMILPMHQLHCFINSRMVVIVSKVLSVSSQVKIQPTSSPTIAVVRKARRHRM